MGMAAGIDPRALSQTSLCSDPESGVLTDLTVLSSKALVTATAVHGAVGFTGAPMQARVVLTGIRGDCRMDRSTGRSQTTKSASQGIQTSDP